MSQSTYITEKRSYVWAAWTLGRVTKHRLCPNARGQLSTLVSQLTATSPPSEIYHTGLGCWGRAYKQPLWGHKHDHAHGLDDAEQFFYSCLKCMTPDESMLRKTPESSLVSIQRVNLFSMSDTHSSADEAFLIKNTDQTHTWPNTARSHKHQGAVTSRGAQARAAKAMKKSKNTFGGMTVQVGSN